MNFGPEGKEQPQYVNFLNRLTKVQESLKSSNEVPSSLRKYINKSDLLSIINGIIDYTHEKKQLVTSLKKFHSVRFYSPRNHLIRRNQNNELILIFNPNGLIYH